MTGDFDGLWEKRRTGDWMDERTDEQIDWLNRLADRIVEKGREPSWRKAARRFEQEFGESVFYQTVQKHTRRLVADRG